MQRKNKMDELTLFEKYPGTKVTYINNIINNRWPEWKAWKDCSEKEKEEANLRCIFPCEIIIDLEELNDLEIILENINNLEEVHYNCFLTGSRGAHIHIIFENLDSLSLEERNEIRKHFIIMYNGDKTKSSETTLIARENKPHFKTLKNKLLYKKNEYKKNFIHQNLIEKIKEKLENNKNLKSTKLEETETFKNYVNEDKFFNYIKNNIIGDTQMRDVVIFKNVSIALVYSGLNDLEIENIMKEIILKNFPGKNLSEFMGWVEKVRKGELKDYNIYEINEWSRKFGHPLFYEEIIEVEEIAKTMNIKQLWDNYFENDIILQPTWRDILFYSLVGIILDERDDDLRIHTFLSCDSTSGKSEGIYKIKKILNLINLKALTYSTATDRNLVGSIDDEAIKYNRKYNLDEMDEKYKSPVLYGTLRDYNFIGFPESERILIPGAFNKDTQNILRLAMDRERNITKGLGANIINFYTNTSFSFGCYPDPKAIKTILHTGLFQRLFFIHRRITAKEHREIRRFILKRNSNFIYNEKEDIYEKYLIEKLLKLKEAWEENKNKFYNNFKLTKENREIIENRLNDLEDRFSSLDYKDLCDINASERRGINMIIKLLKIICFLKNSSSQVTRSDLDYVLDLYTISLESTIKIIEDLKRIELKPLEGKYNQILNMIKNSGGIHRMKLYDLMSKNLGIKSPNTQVKYVEELKKANLIEEQITGHEKILTVYKEKEE